MKKITTKTAPSLTLAFLLAMGSISMESQANEGNDLFLSNYYGETLALSGMHGKPPYNRTKMRHQRKQNQQSVEMSALEIDQDAAVSSQISKKTFRSGHPERSKRNNYR